MPPVTSKLHDAMRLAKANLPGDSRPPLASEVPHSRITEFPLTRVTSLFATRGYNIESLNVAPTDDPTVSRLTLVTSGSEAVVQQIVISRSSSSTW